ncbi:hypothetical protein TNCV_4352551 [Trichonephila clavipes]|nr:hypothetical protein TNCV_4352551 [Trichonephila clavipes]
MSSNTGCSEAVCIDREGIQRLVWPARSPDLNPIENVWDALGRQVAGRNYPPTNKNTLIRALTEKWDKLPQQLLDNVVQSMPLTSQTSPHRMRSIDCIGVELTVIGLWTCGKLFFGVMNFALQSVSQMDASGLGGCPANVSIVTVLCRLLSLVVEA